MHIDTDPVALFDDNDGMNCVENPTVLKDIKLATVDSGPPYI